ncbi:MAG: curli production assembly/transport protein CsgE [Ignavibacteriaceae bacterium]|nr:curli production assembly/transport protein CsgE [Ignavibacteriaceae bacterium]
MLRLFQISILYLPFTGFSNFFILTAQTDTLQINKLDDIEIAGIIIDATQTKIGKDFYDLFYQQWSELEDLPKQSITVSEKALPQLGSQISVQVEDYLIFQQNIQPRYEIIEQMAEYALQQALLYVQNYDEMQKQLMGEDLKGTGIY